MEQKRFENRVDSPKVRHKFEHLCIFSSKYKSRKNILKIQLNFKSSLAFTCSTRLIFCQNKTYPNALLALSTNAKAKKLLQIDIVLVKVVWVLTSEQSRINWCRSPSCVAVYFSVRAPAPRQSAAVRVAGGWAVNFKRIHLARTKPQNHRPPIHQLVYPSKVLPATKIEALIDDLENNCYASF